MYAEFGLRGFTELLTLPLFKKKQPHFSYLKSDSSTLKRTKCSLSTLLQVHMQELKGSQLRGNGIVAKSYLGKASFEAIVFSLQWS